MKTKILIAMTALGALAAAMLTLAQSAPQLINYQGRLANSSGQPLDGVTVDMTFAFYGVEIGGTAYLSVLQEDALVTAGLYNVLLGSGTITPGTETTLADVFQKHMDVWMGVKVDSDLEMAPRIRISTVPFAFMVDMSIIGDFVGQPDWDSDGSNKSNLGGDDCNDANQSVYGWAPELCDGIDNQCPGYPGYGQIDEWCNCVDIDGDGFGQDCVAGEDCNDNDPNNWISCSTCFDSDMDFFYVSCDDYLTIDGPDCNDGNSAIFPLAPELCDGSDNQCPGDPGYMFADEGCPSQFRLEIAPWSESMSIGESGVSEATTVDGHPITLLHGATNGGTCYGTGGGDIKCWLKLINKDPELAMTNVFVNHLSCLNCYSASLNNSDFCGAPGDTCVRNAFDPPVDTAINGSGYCFAEEGRYIPIQQKPFNQYGCNLLPCPTFSSKPIQVIHPKCGQVSVLYDFGNQTELYTFWGSVSATYLPWNPVGTDGIPATGDDDARYDFQNYTTIYLVLADFAGRPGASPLYARGSYQRSNVLAGWGAPGMRSGYTAARDSYFSVNVGIEYPDRIESRVMGDPYHFDTISGYEYYSSYFIFLRWDKNVVDVVNIDKASYGIYNTARNPCWTQGSCDTSGRQSYQHLVPFNPATMGVIDRNNGYIYFYREIAGDFSSYSGAAPYQTNAGGIINVSAGVNREGGHNGVAIFNKDFLNGTITSLETNFRTQEGPDPNPEQNLLNFHFWVNSENSGTSSQIKVDSFVGYTEFHFSHTGLDFYPSGKDEPTDWNLFCSPFTPGFNNSTNQHCNPALGQADYAIFHGIENQNPNLPEMGGESVRGDYGGPQNWSVYVCIQ